MHDDWKIKAMSIGCVTLGVIFMIASFVMYTVFV